MQGRTTYRQLLKISNTTFENFAGRTRTPPVAAMPSPRSLASRNVWVQLGAFIWKMKRKWNGTGRNGPSGRVQSRLIHSLLYSATFQRTDNNITQERRKLRVPQRTTLLHITSVFVLRLTVVNKACLVYSSLRVRGKCRNLNFVGRRFQRLIFTFFW